MVGSFVTISLQHNNLINCHHFGVSCLSSVTHPANTAARCTLIMGLTWQAPTRPTIHRRQPLDFALSQGCSVVIVQ